MYQLLVFIILFMVACQGEVKNPDPPMAPALKQTATTMLNPTATLDTMRLAQLNTWILDDANLFTLVASVLTESLLDMIKGITQGQGDMAMEMMGMGTTMDMGTQNNDFTSLLSSFEGNGWLKLKISCARISNIINGNQDITADLGQINLNMLFTDIKIDPLIWGDAQNCQIQANQYALEMNVHGDLAFFIPSSNAIFDQSWSLAKNTWISFSGNLSLNQHQYQGAQKIMIDTESKRLWLLWEIDQAQSLVISKSPELNDFSVFDLQSADGLWHCDLLNHTCKADQGDAVLSW